MSSCYKPKIFIIWPFMETERNVTAAIDSVWLTRFKPACRLMIFSLRISFPQISGSLEIQMQPHWRIAFPPSQNVNVANGD